MAGCTITRTSRSTIGSSPSRSVPLSWWVLKAYQPTGPRWSSTSNRCAPTTRLPGGAPGRAAPGGATLSLRTELTTPARPLWTTVSGLAFALLPGWARRRYGLPGLLTTDRAHAGCAETGDEERGVVAGPVPIFNTLRPSCTSRAADMLSQVRLAGRADAQLAAGVGLTNLVCAWRPSPPVRQAAAPNRRVAHRSRVAPARRHQGRRAP